MKKKDSLLALLCLLFITNCTTFSGEYGDVNTVEIIDDKWNETDARKTAEVLIKSSLNKPWLAVYQAQHNNAKPIVMVDEIENRTHEHIDTKALTTYIRNELLNSGKVRFIDNKSREKLLEELKYQRSELVDKKTAIKKGAQIGAGFMLTGEMSVNGPHIQGGLKILTYQTELRLTNLETSEIIWTEVYQIKKRFKRSGAGW